ncbi:ketoacyl-ACP synthase III [Sphingobacterium siyangense]|uniref:3-oxoacyl-ACP synthase III family protein n=1 Tax=Sphingobacterium siyangense TaxID=459529 RepID=UPI00200C678F|nr:ketoacyl-ACP synthase III [Sphingobacterium siyangense]UQA75585.1 ketoacyl-ACP synthase III [Sphingobacterium siyangense]
MKSYLKHISVYLPDRNVTNEDIAEMFPSWESSKIFEKVGIKNRYVADSKEGVADMAVAAIRNLQLETGIDLSQIDYFLLCTQSPDYQIPTTACIVQHRVGLSNNCGAIDINQGCSGYIYGLSLASALVSSGIANNVLLVTADVYSKHIHNSDKGNMSLFGDAATASLISSDGKYEIGKFSLGTDGSGYDKLIIKNSGLFSKSLNQDDPENFLFMDGAGVFDFTAKRIPQLIEENLVLNGLAKDDINLFVFHQANTFMLNFLRNRIKIEKNRFLINMENYGNTVSSSIPLAFKDSFDGENRNVMMVGFGVGLSWGAVVLLNK